LLPANQSSTTPIADQLAAASPERELSTPAQSQSPPTDLQSLDEGHNPTTPSTWHFDVNEEHNPATPLWHFSDVEEENPTAPLAWHLNDVPSSPDMHPIAPEPSSEPTPAPAPAPRSRVLSTTPVGALMLPPVLRGSRDKGAVMRYAKAIKVEATRLKAFQRVQRVSGGI
jgi:hypothetical protein